MISENLLEIIKQTIKNAEFCFLITHGEAGQINSRLMQPYEPDDDLTVWLGTSPRSRKIQEIQQAPQITLSYAYPADGAYLTLQGEASIESGLAQRQHHWRDAFRAFWPDGPAGDDYVVIKFVPTRIEVMNIGQEVAPAPFGLRPLILQRTSAGWVEIEA